MLGDVLMRNKIHIKTDDDIFILIDKNCLPKFKGYGKVDYMGRDDL